jgi:hypothetical protein
VRAARGFGPVPFSDGHDKSGRIYDARFIHVISGAKPASDQSALEMSLNAENAGLVADLPLVVDLDKTSILTDTLDEQAAQAQPTTYPHRMRVVDAAGNAARP